MQLLPVLESADDMDVMDAWDTSEAWEADMLGMLRPNADLGVKLGILEALLPHMAAFLLVTSPVATGACAAPPTQKATRRYSDDDVRTGV